jgi:glycosyltransferase involved in cell wall biosynthesis
MTGGEKNRPLQRVLVVIPAFNEEKSIAAVAREALASYPGVEVLVVDDCSTDRTAAILQAEGINHVTLPVNLGIGGAVQTGFLYAWEKGHDIVMQVDGDGQHPPAQIPLLLEAMEKNSWDAVIGSRYAAGSQIVSTWARRFGGALLGAIIRLAAGQRVTDPTSGFRAYNRRALAYLRQHYPQEYPEPIIAIELVMNGFKLGEVSIAMKERRHGASSITGMNTLFYMIKVIFAIIIVKIRRRR